MHQPPLQTIQTHQIQTLVLAAQAQLHVVSGCLWITQTNDPCDHFLAPEQSMLLRAGRVVVQAEKDSIFLLDPSTDAVKKKPCQLSPTGLVLNAGLIRRSRLWPFPRTLQSG